MIKNIVSDLGGCLFLCDFKHIAENLTKHSLLNVERVLKIIDQGNDYKDYEKGLIGSETFYRKIREKIDFRDSFKVFKKIWMGHIFSVNAEYAKLCFNLLKRDYKIYCLSNINELHWEKLTNVFHEMALFHGCFLSFKMKKAKPNLEIYEEIITKIGGKPNEFIFIDDRKENVEGAQKAGMHALLYRHKKHDEFVKTIELFLK